MKIAQRTFTPFDGLSPATEKSRAVPLFGDTPSFADIINGDVSKKIDIHDRGSWGAGKDADKTYREEGNDFMREVTDRDRVLQDAFKRRKSRGTEWAIEFEDGTVSSFPSKPEAEQAASKAPKPVRRIFTRTAQSHADIIDMLMGGCVTIYSSEGGGKSSVGAGFFVKEGIVVTCAHVVRSFDDPESSDEREWLSRKVMLHGRAGEDFGTVIHASLRLDIAVISTKFAGTPMGIVESRKIRIGDPVFTVGAPHGFESNVSEGILSGRDRTVFWHKGAPKFLFTDAQVAPGNSGGPLIEYGSKAIIGMMQLIVGASRGLPGLNAALPSEDIIKSLARIPQGFSPSG